MLRETTEASLLTYEKIWTDIGKIFRIKQKKNIEQNYTRNVLYKLAG